MRTSLTVLVVDDDKDFRNALSDAILRSGYLVIEARDGVDALDKMGHNSIDLVVSDIDMPVMGGMALLIAMAKARDKTPVILITGNLEFDEQRAIDYGARGFLRKPFTVRSLVAMVSAEFANEAIAA